MLITCQPDRLNRLFKSFWCAMFQNLIQRLIRQRAETPGQQACAEMRELLDYLEEQDYDAAIEYIIFESNFEPTCALTYLYKNASSTCCFEKLEIKFKEYTSTIEAKEFFDDRLLCEYELRARIEKLATLLHAMTGVHA